MKNFLLFLLGLSINVLYTYVLWPIFIICVMSFLWVPILFEFKGAFIIGIVISILTLVIAEIVECKLESY